MGLRGGCDSMRCMRRGYQMRTCSDRHRATSAVARTRLHVLQRPSHAGANVFCSGSAGPGYKKAGKIVEDKVTLGNLIVDRTVWCSQICSNYRVPKGEAESVCHGDARQAPGFKYIGSTRRASSSKFSWRSLKQRVRDDTTDATCTRITPTWPIGTQPAMLLFPSFPY
jgi:hypothetical protein